LNDIADSQLTACAFTSDGVINSIVRERYPTIAIQAEDKSAAEGEDSDEDSETGRNVYVENMRMGQCAASFTFAINVNLLKGNPDHCDIVRVGDGVEGDLPLMPHSKGGGFAIHRAAMMDNSTEKARTECIRQSVTASMSR
jgi:hypothetical protein